MGKRISTTEQHRPRARRGFTLVESIFASVLLSVTVVAVSGAISASYAQDKFAADRAAAFKSGAQLLNEVSALPLDAENASSPSIMKYASYTDEAEIGTLTSVVNKVSAATPITDSESTRDAKRTVTVERKSSLNGAASATGDFAIVGVEVKNGSQKVRIKRLVTAAESAATR